MTKFRIEIELNSGELSDFEQVFLEGTKEFEFSYEIIED